MQRTYNLALSTDLGKRDLGEDWQAVAAVHGEFFGQIRPASTIMQVSRFIDPDWLVEFETDAIIAGAALLIVCLTSPHKADGDNEPKKPPASSPRTAR